MKYKVVGTQPVVDAKGQSHNPGEEFSAELENEAFLIEIGAIEKVKAAAKSDKSGKGDA